MIPQKLQLKNFLSYGSEIEEIDFSPYHLICLSGNNGHGKSALLDAMTWAIWGQARKTSGNAKADQGLLRLGQKQMLVLFEFLFNGYRYRIKREFMLTHGKPYTVLEFAMVDESGELISLTEKSIRMTQAKIEQLLGLDYAAFINSAFLRQGQSNEFSKKSAKERKEILASILGLDAYEDLRKRAQEKSRAAQHDKDGLLKVIERIATALEREEPLKQEQAACAKELTVHDTTLATCAQDRIKITSRGEALAQQAQDHAVLTSQVAQARTNETALYDRMIRVRTAWQQTHRLLIGAGSLDQQRIEALKKELAGFDHSRDKSIKLKERSLQHQEGLQRRGAELDKTHHESVQTLKSQLQQETAAQEIEVKQQAELSMLIVQSGKEQQLHEGAIKTIDEHTATMRKNIESLVEHQKRFDKRRDTYQQFIAQANTVSAELKGLGTKQGLSQDERNPSCPLCEQNLSASRKKFLKKKFGEQEQFYVHRLTRLKKLIADLKPVLMNEHVALQKRHDEKQHLEVALVKREEATKQLTQQRTLCADYERKVQAFTTGLKERSSRILAVQEKHTKLTAHDPKQVDASYIELKKQCDSVSAEFAKLGYDQVRHQDAQKAYRKLEQQAEAIEQRDHHMKAQAERVSDIVQYIQQIKQLRKELKSLVERLAVLDKLLAERKSLQEAFRENERRSRMALAEREKLLQVTGRLENEQLALSAQKRERIALEKKMCACENISNEYRAIAQALGKDGIQALLIEDAIPEIEQEANALLSRLSNNQAQIFIESLRDLKKGGTKETLDINIADTAGIRPYEMFSGGEAFRIDFALRIAISKLLARRAGTSLQTLIIDEGFGSQDEDGLNQIMESLYAVQDDFSKIIIVSHLPSMKEQFPVHFVVTKGTTGSRVSVIEQG